MASWPCMGTSSRLRAPLPARPPRARQARWPHQPRTLAPRTDASVLERGREVAEAFLRLHPYFKCYAQYCANYPYAPEAIVKACADARVTSFLAQAEATHQIKLQALLFRPVQRMFAPTPFEPPSQHSPHRHRHTHGHTRTRTHIHTRTHTHARARACVRVRACMYVCACACVSVCVTMTVRRVLRRRFEWRRSEHALHWAEEQSLQLDLVRRLRLREEARDACVSARLHDRLGRVRVVGAVLRVAFEVWMQPQEGFRHLASSLEHGGIRARRQRARLVRPPCLPRPWRPCWQRGPQPRGGPHAWPGGHSRGARSARQR